MKNKLLAILVSLSDVDPPQEGLDGVDIELDGLDGVDAALPSHGAVWLVSKKSTAGHQLEALLALANL